MDDTTSKVPKYRFSAAPAEQLRELASNPMLARFAESRERLSEDPHRPAYHFVSPEGNLNDPNGLCFWQGRWHLFYQGYPPEDPRQHWGHAVSDDLIHWRDLPYAIYPSPEEACFSGATLVEDGRVLAMYHGLGVGNMIATSTDRLLLNWEKLTGGPVMPMVNRDGSTPPYNVFDPCIWRIDGTYYSLSGGKQTGPGGGWVRGDFLLRSQDLCTWEPRHEFVEGDRFTMVGDDGACPYFWPIGNRHMLLFFSHQSGGQYLLGDYDIAREKFVATSGDRFNFGPAWPSGVHAPSATPDGRGGLIVIFNMNAGKVDDPAWDQVMSLPRRLSLIDPYTVGVEVAGDIESLRHGHIHVGPTTLPANSEVAFDRVRGNTLELVAEINPGDASVIELDVLRSPGGEERTRILYFPATGWTRYFRDTKEGRVPADDSGPITETGSFVTIDTTYSTTLPHIGIRAPETGHLFTQEFGQRTWTWPPPSMPTHLKLRVFIDRSIVEVFVNDRLCVAERVYPGRRDSRGVSLRAQGADAQLVSLDAWQMSSIYGDSPQGW